MFWAVSFQMTASTTNKIKSFVSKTILGIIVFSFWIGIWAIAAMFVGNSYFLPTPLDSLVALLALSSKVYFYKVIFASFFRVILGLFIGLVFGVSLGSLCHISAVFRKFISPIITVLKAMPVATFIIILWITMMGSRLTVFIGVIMVLPIIYQNTLEGFDSIDVKLRELSMVFELSFLRKFRLLIFPTLFSYIYPALITSVGLAFKSQIAAEIIAYTKNSIGQYIFDAKYNLNTPEVFAWAIVIVVFSITVESLTKLLGGKIKNAA